jgi:hypothetical protein
MFSETLCSWGTESTDIQIVAEQFVQHIYLRKQENILDVFEFTDSFKSIIIAEPKIQHRWAKEMEQMFGNLGSLSHSEIISDNDNVNSVYFYYQGKKYPAKVYPGTKHPAKIWITFKEHKIDGIHWNIWADGHDENTFLQKWDSLLWSLFIACCFIYPIACIFLGERIRKRYVQKLRSDYQYQDEHLLSSYTESQNPSWCFILYHGLTLYFIIILCLVVLLMSHIVSIIEIIFIITVFILIILLCDLLPLSMTGFFIEVNDQYLTVRMGIFRLRILRLELKNIQSAETITFRPIRDFGGWGIRMGNNGWAYFMSGTEGVLINMTNRQKYMIGSDIPDRLVKVIQNKLSHFT